MTGAPALELDVLRPEGANDFVFLTNYSGAVDLLAGIAPVEDNATPGAGAQLFGFGSVSTAGVTMTLSDNTTITIADFTGGPEADAGAS
ncbi:MAG: hypothetical protein ACJ8AW_15595 [Rhodopila sp.]